MWMKYTLDSAVDAHAESPETFHIPSGNDRGSLGRGDFAKLIFRFSDGNREFVERMWVRVESVGSECYVGLLDNDPYNTDQIRAEGALNSARTTLSRFSETRPDRGGPRELQSINHTKKHIPRRRSWTCKVLSRSRLNPNSPLTCCPTS
jgi:hypothetical protein